MADKYSDYLVKNKLLKQNRPEENASIYVELLGMVDKTMLEWQINIVII